MCSAVSSGCAGDIILKRKFSVRLVVSERERERRRERALSTLLLNLVSSLVQWFCIYIFQSQMKIQSRGTMPNLRRSSSRRVKKNWPRSTLSTLVMTATKARLRKSVFVWKQYNSVTFRLADYTEKVQTSSSLPLSSSHQKSWLRRSGDLRRCRMNYSRLWMPRGRAGQMGGAWGGGGRFSLCPNRNDANTGTSRTCS